MHYNKSLTFRRGYRRLRIWFHVHKYPYYNYWVCSDSGPYKKIVRLQVKGYTAFLAVSCWGSS